MREKGFTLLELMVVIAILSIIAMMAGPSVSGFIDKRKVINAAEAVYGQLQFARSQAISRSSRVYAKFDYSDPSDAKTWLMGLHEDDVAKDCDVTLTDDCYLVVDDGDADNVVHGVNGGVDLGDLVSYIISGADFNGVELDADGSGTGGAPIQFFFDPTRGVVKDAVLTTPVDEVIFLKYKDKYEMQVRVAVIGRVRICTPDNSDKQVSGYTVCND